MENYNIPYTLNCGGNIVIPTKYSCGDIDPFNPNDELLKIDNYNPSLEELSDQLIKRNCNYINKRNTGYGSSICDRNLATECLGYKDIELENKIVYLTNQSVRGYCPEKDDKTECVNGINFDYHGDIDKKLLAHPDYINCRNLPPNMMCAAPICCDTKLNNKLWNNITKNK
jgi:hypothetical protein